MHQHHRNTFEWCPDFDARVEEINTEQPEAERSGKLKCFRMLTEEETAMLPKEFVEACKNWDESSRNRVEAYRKWEEADMKYRPHFEELHKQICGCKEWNGEKLVFSTNMELYKENGEKAGLMEVCKW